jgi:hypothetical protein
VIKLGTTVTGQVPGPVGGLATGLLNSVGKTVDSVLPPAGAGGSLVSSTASAVSSTVSSVTSSVHLP